MENQPNSNSNSISNSNPDNLCCPICLDTIESKDFNYISTVCSHSFHSNCMIKYIIKISKNNLVKCPQCRTKLFIPDHETENSDFDQETNSNTYPIFNQTIISNLYPDSNTNSNTESDSDSETNIEFNISSIGHNGINSTVMNYFQNTGFQIDLISGMWTTRSYDSSLLNIIEHSNNTLNTNTNADTDSDEEIKKLKSNNNE